MAGLSPADRTAFTALLRRCADHMLTQVLATVQGACGARAMVLRAMVSEELRERRLRAIVLAPLLPLFRPRADGVPGLTFPEEVLDRLWQAARESEADLLSALDPGDEQAIGLAGDRICPVAASLVRDKPSLIWPEELSTALRPQGLGRLAACLDLCSLARRALPSLEAWLKRPDREQVAELRLLVRDSASIHPDGVRLLLEILFAHLQDAVLILRIISHTSPAAAREEFLRNSELTDFVDRLLLGVSVRADRLLTYPAALDANRLKRLLEDLDWCAGVLGELDVTIALEPGSDWGQAVRKARLTLSGRLTDLMKGASQSMEAALPLTRVRIVGRMTRLVPLVSAPADGEAVELARSRLRLVGAIRGAAATFGCEADRRALETAVTERLINYADQVLGMLNDGEVEDQTQALKLVETAAACLQDLGARGPARTVRRRAAVAGSPLRRERLSSPAV